MRIASLLVLGLAALTCPADALRSSASSTLARLSQRLAAAESALAELRSQSSVESDAESLIRTQVQPYPTPNTFYHFDYSTYVNKFNTAQKGEVLPAGANNIGFIYDNNRVSQVMIRNPSNTYAASYVSFPTQLTPTFTLGLWLNWNGVSTGSENHVIDSADGDFQLYLDGTGKYNVVIGGVKQTDPKAVEALVWRFYAVVEDGSSFSLFRADKADGFVKLGQVAASYAGAATTLRVGNAASASADKGWYGEIDSIAIYTSALSDSQVADLWWGTNSGAQPTGQAPTAPSKYYYYGHFDQSQVTFSNRYAGQPAGDFAVTIAVRDIDVKVGDEIKVRFYGCTGVSTAAPVTLADGTVVSYIASNGVLSIKPAQDIPEGSVKKFAIPASQVQVTNPATVYASASDARWQIGLLFSSGQIAQTGIHYEGVRITPATLNPNPQLL